MGGRRRPRAVPDFSDFSENELREAYRGIEERRAAKSKRDAEFATPTLFDREPQKFRAYVDKAMRQDQPYLDSIEQAPYPPGLDPAGLPPLFHGSASFGRLPGPKSDYSPVGTVHAGSEVDPTRVVRDGAPNRAELGPAALYSANAVERARMFGNPLKGNRILQIDVDAKPEDFIASPSPDLGPVNPELFRALVAEFRKVSPYRPLRTKAPEEVVDRMRKAISTRELRRLGKRESELTYADYLQADLSAQQEIFDAFRRIGAAGIMESYGDTTEKLGYLRNLSERTMPNRNYPDEFLPSREYHFAIYRPELIKTLVRTGFSVAAATALADRAVAQQQALSGLMEE